MKITQQQAQELLELYRVGDTTEDWDNFDLKFKLIQSELIETKRWSHVYEVVYQDLTTGKFYSSIYSTGATECQDETPYEYEKEVELVEVEPKEKVIIEYVAV